MGDAYDECPKVPVGLTTYRLCEENADNAVQKVNWQCQNEQACELVASNLFFDDDSDSCGDVYKYLKVSYECVSDDSNSVDVLRGSGGDSEMVAMELNVRTVSVMSLLVVL